MKHPPLTLASAFWVGDFATELSNVVPSYLPWFIPQAVESSQSPPYAKIIPLLGMIYSECMQLGYISVIGQVP